MISKPICGVEIIATAADDAMTYKLLRFQAIIHVGVDNYAAKNHFMTVDDISVLCRNSCYVTY